MRPQDIASTGHWGRRPCVRKDAKSLYYILTGELIQSSFPDIREYTDPRDSYNNENLKVKVFPNPFTTSLTFNKTGNGIAILSVYNLLGTLMHKSELEFTKTISTENWSSGMYTVKITYKNDVLLLNKLVLVK